MTHLSLAALIVILVACAVIALAIGYLVGSRFGGKKSVAMREATEKHDSYKNDVREHFDETSAIMARMVDDYRDMYRHLAEGAQKLADIHPEKRVAPPPAPEAITQDDTGADNAKAAQNPGGVTDETTGARQGAGEAPAHPEHDTPKPDPASDKDSTRSNRLSGDEPPSKRYGLE